MKNGLKHLSVVLLVFGTAGSLAGQARGYPGSPPGRTAGWQYVSGQVSQAPCDSSDWVAAEVNQPLKAPVCVWADKDSRAELNVADGYIRMSSETSITLTTVNRGNVRFGLNQGVASLTVRFLLPGEIFEIDTPNATLTVMKPGVYRVDVVPTQDQTLVTVRRGAIAATGAGNSVTVNAGQQVRFQNKTSMQHTAEKAPAPDGFDDWANVRDQRLGVRTSPFGIVLGYPPPPYGPPGFWVQYSH